MRRVTGYHEFSWDKTGLGVTLSIWPPRGLGQFAVRKGRQDAARGTRGHATAAGARPPGGHPKG